ncbi:LysR family transcriptional regulator [Notoacmeibacter sp. MSK16QG-6]|uniref:LysR family transcriptional regulator n=1 Tax=Notoacmeibacter sp. MSK16QG-6 TaxID=2957982 RepID=UPI0020A175C8|nr:LysR family transcriptional regulator [Notoacmeibacter sp. MSK16QG-6]MCP1200548.1 LysR family transcriptional regulator [Notoacmeibacter sp. MSK16QG-6]
MITRNLRHLRLFLAVAGTGKLTLASKVAHVSQPAVTQAISKLERECGGALFDRTRQGFFVTPRGEALVGRLRRAFDFLDPALADVSPRLKLTATMAQLQALNAVVETENVTLAARRLRLAQPTVHRAITLLEREAGRKLFERMSFGMLPSRQTAALSRAIVLAFHEFDQAEADLAEFEGMEVGRIVVGALPLARSALLPQSLVAFRSTRPRQNVLVVDGLYGELLTGLRRGDIDVIVGALRQPAPIGDIVQEPLFDDHLAIIAGKHHPLVGKTGLSRETLAAYPWVVPRKGTPARGQFDEFFDGMNLPHGIIEAGSILLMREIIGASDHLGCISGQQAVAEISRDLIVEIDVGESWPGRPIGLTYRKNWVPTKAQSILLDLIREQANTQSL